MSRKSGYWYKLGADPEFELIDWQGDRERFVPAFEAFGESNYNSELGCDGHPSTAEIRPKPGNYAEVTSHINRLLAEAATHGYAAYAGSGKFEALGGHIHFSGIDPSCLLLDKLATFITEPLNKVSDTNLRQGDGSYGTYRFGSMSLSRREEICEFREQPHGWEYRAPLSWISTPVLCRGTLAIASVLARAAKLERLRKIATVGDLKKLAYKAERVAITKFYSLITELQQQDKVLEQVEIFQAWGKSVRTKRTASNQISFGQESGLMDIRDALRYSIADRARRRVDYLTYTRMHIVGMRSSRLVDAGATREDDGIMVHPALIQYLPSDIVVMFERWDRHDERWKRLVTISEPGQEVTRIGLSPSLRQYEVSAYTIDIIRELVKAVNRWYLAQSKKSKVDKLPPPPERKRINDDSDNYTRARDYDEYAGDYDNDEDEERPEECEREPHRHPEHCGTYTCNECNTQFGHMFHCRYDGCEYCNEEYGILPLGTTHLYRESGSAYPTDTTL